MLTSAVATSIESQKSRSTNITALCGLIVVLILPQLPIGRWIAPCDAISALLIRELVRRLYAAGVLAWLRFGEGLPVSSIGLHRPTWKGLLYSLAGVSVLFSENASHHANRSFRRVARDSTAILNWCSYHTHR